jgi:hypothetical protein
MPRLVASLALLTLGVTTACGGRSTRFADDEGPGAGGNERCRTYAKRFTLSGREMTCTFVRSELRLSCLGSGGMLTTTWDTLESVLADNRPIGRVTFATRSYVDADCTFTNAVTYDDARRPLSRTAGASPENHCGNDGAVYSAWDDAMRPLSGVAYGVGAIACEGQVQSFIYDDANRRVTRSTTGGAGPRCSDFVHTLTFDADGLPLDVELVVDGTSRSDQHYATLETGLICPD